MVNLLVGIVTYKSRDIISSCINAIKTSAKELDYRIFIYDNSSFDGTSQFISQNFSDVSLISSSENYGYARGVNEIAKSCAWKYMLIVNPDVRVNEESIPIAMKFIESRNDVSLLGANLIDSEGKSVHSWGDLPTPSMFKYDFSGLRRWFPREKWTSTKTVTNEKEPFEAGYVTGAFMLISRNAWESTGPMDERFFLYFEDTDYSYRLHKLNRKVMVHPGVIAVHESGASFGDNEESREYKMKCYFESAYKYFWKHYGEAERDMVFDRVVQFAKLKLTFLILKGEGKSDASNRQRMILKIHRELARDVFKR